MIKVTLPIETPVIHVPLSGRVGGTLPHKSYSSLSWEDQTANGHLHGQSPRSGFAVIGPFEPMPSGTGIAPPRCHPPLDGGTLRHVNNSLPGPGSEGSVHGNGSRQQDNWLLALAEPFVTVQVAHGNGVIFTKLDVATMDASGCKNCDFPLNQKDLANLVTCVLKRESTKIVINIIHLCKTFRRCRYRQTVTNISSRNSVISVFEAILASASDSPYHLHWNAPTLSRKVYL